MEESAASSKEPFANVITGSKADNNLFCCVCCKPVYAAIKLNTHLRSYGHKICVERCKSVFEDHGEKVFCKTCKAEIEWNEIERHGVMHQIPPWCESTKPCSKTFYHNHTVFFGRGYYFCYLCERFLDYWDTASSHFMETDHQDRREKFGTTADLSNIDHMYAIANGIVPGRDMTIDCKMCEKTGLKDEDIEEHSETVKHKENARKTAANIFKLHETKKNSAVLETSILEAEESTSELLKVELVKKEDNSENIKEQPRSCNMIFNSSLQECEEPSDMLYANKITGSRTDKDLFCCVCSKTLNTRYNLHARNYVHKIHLERCKLAFEDRGEKVFCKICSCEIGWKEIVHHGEMHEITPWSEVTKPSSETFYRNHTVVFPKKYCYCYLCERFLDYWDTASSHFMEADHQDRRDKFGPTSDLLNIDYMCAIANGIVPGRNMTNECKMCEKTDLEAKNIEAHSKTETHKKNTRITAANIIELHNTEQKSAVLETSFLEAPESTSKLLEIDPLTQDERAKEIQSGIIKIEQEESRDDAFPNVFTESGNKWTLFCCTCCKPFKRAGKKHQLSYKHKIYLQRCKTVFQNRGKKVYCKTCNSEIEWKAIEYHVERHEIAPWCESRKPNSQTLFHNHTIKFVTGYYFCFLCETFLDYWDTAISHFMEAHHQTRKRKFGPTELVETNFVLAVTQGIVPGKDMMNECKMCDITGLTIEDMKEHIKTATHKENRVKFGADITRKHDETENRADSQSNSLDTEESTSKLLEADVLPKEIKPKNIKVPYSRSMICNFSLQENPEESIPERKESSTESGNVCKIKTEKSEANITMEQEKRKNYADSDSESSEFKESTCDLFKVELTKNVNNYENIEEPESHNMIFNFSLQESSNSATESCPTESGNVGETFHPLAVKQVELSDDAFTNKIIVLNEGQRLFCCVCGKHKKELAKHLRSYGHKIHLERCKSAFEYRGNKFFCKMCSSEIVVKQIVHHAKMHEITPWCEFKQPSSESFYRNRTVRFTQGFCYCFLCETFLDYWDTAGSHFGEPDHQERKEKFGPIADLEGIKCLNKMRDMYVYAQNHGILPGLDMTFECKMCNKTGLNTQDIELHVKTKDHRKSSETTAANILNKHQEKQNLSDSETNGNMTFDVSVQESLEMTPKDLNSTKESGNHRKSSETTAANILNKHQEKQNLSDSETNGNMTFDVSVQESLLMTPKDVNSPKESGNANETLKPLRYTVFANGILCTLQAKKWFCRTCRELFLMLDEHLDSYKHKVYVQRFESAFEDRGEIFFCNICSSGIDWETLYDHGRKHGIPPWAGHSPSAKCFFQNHTAKFSPGCCYCFLCERFLDYWDTAAAHFKEADHQKRKLDFGPILGSGNFPATVADGIAPGKNGMFDCKMCHITGSKADMKKHLKAKSHKKNLEEFTITLIKNHEERKNPSDSVSDFLGTAASTSKPLKPVPSKKDDSPKKIEVPYSRTMICNFTLEEIRDKEIPEEKENPENNQTIDETEYPKLPVEGKPPESAEAALESINQNDDGPIKYIVSSTSKLSKTKDHRKNTETTAANILSKHQEKKNLSDSEPNANMTFDFSLQESLKMTPMDLNSPKESGNANETSHPSPYVVFAHGIVGALQSKKWYCRPCRQSFSVLDDHLDSYKHKVYVQRFESVFEDRGEKFFCKICSSEIEWAAIKDHGAMHEIPPWAGHSTSAKFFFQNHTAKFSPGYCYCFVCERFLDYWDTAAAHFKKADHKNRKRDFGPIVDLHKFPAAVANGILPGKNRMFDCKMCHITGSKADMKQHSKAKNHKKNLEKFTITLIKNHEESKNLSDSASDFLDTAASTSNPLKPIPPKKDDNPKKIQVPYSRNMICNFTLEEIPDKEIPEEKESPANNQTIYETEYPKLPVEGKPPESSKAALETIHQNDGWPIQYIVSSTSELCKMAIVGTDMQRKRKIAKQNTEEPDPYCLICYSEIPGYAAVNDHLKGKRHETARQKYGCDNILLIEGDHYWCSACDGPVSGFNNVYRHITSNSHLSAIVRYQSNDHERQNNLDQVENLMEAEESLPCLYIVKRNAKKSFCQICDETQHPVATKNINDHIASQRHKIALKRYGCDKIVPKGNDNYYCKCCLSNISNIENLYLHIKDKKHMSSLIKVCNNEGQRGKRRMETQMLPEDLNKPFQNLLSNYIAQQFNKSLPSEAYETWQHSMASNFNFKPNHTDRSNLSNRFEPPGQTWGNSTANQNSGGFGFMSNFDFTEVKRKTEESQYRGQKLSALEHEAQAKKIYCNVCGAKAEDTTELHVHMASHYAEEFVRFKSKKMKRADESSYPAEQAPNGLLDQPEIELDDEITNGFALNGFLEPTVESSNGEIGENSSENDKTELVTKSGVTIQDKGDPQKMNRSGKRADMRKVTKQLNFDADHIYDLDDKMEEVELGMMLGLVVDSSKMYCLICRNLVEYTLDNYYEHLENIDHCEYLEEMEADDALFHDCEDQFSDLALAKEYMEETSRNKVRCVICDEDVKNNARSLQAHIYHEIHERKCEETRAIARRCFERIKPRMYCDWYEVKKYWCVVCQSDTESEVNFMKHLNDKTHKKAMRRPENRDKRLFFDFCASCAVLWYGYRCTHSYHNDINSHKWLQRDGHYVLMELPKLAKSLLAAPEDFVDDKIKFLDAVFESELEREKLLIRDLERAAKMRFPRSKAHLFGSRISGLGSPDSDIDVFLDCRDFYDGHDLTNDELLFFINGVHQCLCKDPQLWDVDELLTDCRIPIIKATHRATELSCDISFENGLSVENTKLIKAFNHVFPTCRKITLFLKQWLLHCGLSGSRGITSYALYWFVIFYLQQETIFPSVERLIAMRRRSHRIAGWEVGVTHNFTYNEEVSTLTFKNLLIRFFIFYANFDFRYNVACPLLGEVVEKRQFVNPRSLPREMERYIAYMRGRGNPEPFRIDSPMCIQDPFDLQHNLTKAVNKVYLNRFRKCCAKSLEILCPP